MPSHRRMPSLLELILQISTSNTHNNGRWYELPAEFPVDVRLWSGHVLDILAELVQVVKPRHHHTLRNTCACELLVNSK